jgi:hypothetical protein
MNIVPDLNLIFLDVRIVLKETFEESIIALILRIQLTCKK